MYIRIRDNKVQEVRFNIFEPPRFFEAFLRGRRYTEAPDITARICGICPVAYLMSACHAMEDICGIEVGGRLRELRRLLYCSEWIESHGLHIYMLHAPDFLGYEDAIQMARDHGDMVQRGLRLKKLGNDLMTCLGGREVHPINIRVGGFYRVPTRRELERFIEPLHWAIDASKDTVARVASFPFPDYERDYEFVSLRHPDEYPLCEGRLVSNRGIDIDISEFFDYFEERHVAHSTSLHSVVRERDDYLTGPLARYSNNFDLLPPMVQEAAGEAGLGETCTNPFKSIIVRSVEVLYACHEALRIIENYERPEKPCIEAPPRAGVGHGCTEAPRGSLYHRYETDSEGIIRDARIVAPTSQNQKAVERDLHAFVSENTKLPDDKLTWQCEQAIRNYDPCISCSCHFLKLKVDRE